MCIASLVLAYVRFVPAMDGIDFREASIETTREYASRLTGYTLRELVNIVAISRHGGSGYDIDVNAKARGDRR